MKLSCEVDLYVRLYAVMALTLLGVAVRAQTSAALTGLATNTPTPGINDISQLLTSGQTNMPDGLNYYTDEQTTHNAGEPGQTFTTGTNGAGYLLNSVTIKTGGGTSSNTGTNQSYLLHIYSVSGGTNATLLATYSATNFAFTDGYWLQWSSFSLSLSANAVFAYSFGKASSAIAGWDQLGNAKTNLYTRGEI